jgi:hypothetical protein
VQTTGLVHPRLADEGIVPARALRRSA